MLRERVSVNKSEKILECGAAIGLTSIAIALGNDQAEIISLDRNAEDLVLAAENATKYGVSEQIEYVQGEFLDLVAGLESKTFDLVFFDGFAPGLTIFLELERVLKSGGHMVCANLTLGGDQKKIRAKMMDEKFYTESREFEDTLVGRKV